MKPYNFEDQLKAGVIGEVVVYDYFTKVLGEELIDLRSDEIYQKMGIDFKLKDRNKTIEVKTDNRKSNDLIIEVVNSTLYNTEGWVYTTVSDWIAFYKSHHKKIYMVKTIELKVLNHLLNMNQPIAVAKDSADKKSLDYGICKKVDLTAFDLFDSKDFIVFDLTE